MLAGLTAPSSDPGNPLGDRGLAALVAPPLTGALTQLEVLNVDRTQVRGHNCHGHICYSIATHYCGSSMHPINRPG